MEFWILPPARGGGGVGGGGQADANGLRAFGSPPVNSAVLVLVVGVLLLATAVVPSGRVHRDVAAFVLLGCGLVLALRWGLWARRRFGARYRAEQLGAGRCPGCRYAVASLKTEADGCVVCPECGAAWRLEGASA